MSMNRLLVLLLPLFFLLASCKREKQADALAEVSNSLTDIKAKGKLVVLTDYSSTNYFIYRGQPLGYQYEMLQELANYLNVKLELRVNSDLENSFVLLNRGEVDLIAENIIITFQPKSAGHCNFDGPFHVLRRKLALGGSGAPQLELSKSLERTIYAVIAVIVLLSLWNGQSYLITAFVVFLPLFLLAQLLVNAHKAVRYLLYFSITILFAIEFIILLASSIRCI